MLLSQALSRLGRNVHPIRYQQRYLHASVPLLKRSPSKKRSKAAKAASKTDEPSTKGASPSNDDGSADDPHQPMSELEYQKSIWEASRREGAPDAEGILLNGPGFFGQQVSEDHQQSPDSEQSSDTRHSTLLASLRKQLEDIEREGYTSPTLGKSKKNAAAKAKSKEETAEKSESSKSEKEPRRRRALGTPLPVRTAHAKLLNLVPVAPEEQREVPQLSHNLERVLFNPGVYQLQDPRTQVFNFDPYLASIMAVEDFDFDALQAYITSSKDERLMGMARKFGAKYCGSTSSTTSVLSHFHYLLSAWRQPNYDQAVTKGFEIQTPNFTSIMLAPAACYARLKNGVYAIDSDKQYDKENVLSMLGKSMEKLLTLPKEEYEKYRRTRSHLIPEEDRNAEEAYNYSTIGDFLLRSQLDAKDPRLPGGGVFDLKTRAVVSIRMDVHDYQKYRDYEIRDRFGQWESYEKEYVDLIRAAFLKYSLQVRMGRMDGIFVAYHNTQRIFGFQYIGLEEMDKAIHGTTDTRLGDDEFKLSIKLLNELMDRATQRFPGRSLRFHVETRPTNVPLTYFFVQPVTDEEIKQDESSAKAVVERITGDLIRQRGSIPQEAQEESIEEGETAETSTAPGTDNGSGQDVHNSEAWEEMIAKVEDTIENESLGVASVRGALRNALEERDLLQAASEEENQQTLDMLVEALASAAPGRREVKETAEETQPDYAKENTDANAEPSSTESGDESNQQSQQDILKNLIVKVTEVAEAKKHELRDFERLVAELAERTRDGSSNGQQWPEDDSPSETRSTEVKSEAEVTDAIRNGTDANNAEAQKGESDKDPENIPELLGMYVTIRNKVNGKEVERPTLEDARSDSQRQAFQWSLEYSITDIPDQEAQRIYRQITRRRSAALNDEDPRKVGNRSWNDAFKDQLQELSKSGRRYRKALDKKQSKKETQVAWRTEDAES
ncbi:PET127-like protein [Emericellopsis atlantica]|uniref:PET127-like protein n=1 Tax=Emericellopsis atlantica TaxID=2614577 RepID=A0A9P7ZEZ2_9HYPO|nr:PET127-like protein [Emericellopsis atlantica]KAG9250883.1 PET127-like protein [Emericellopsis atlantica]